MANTIIWSVSAESGDTSEGLIIIEQLDLLNELLIEMSFEKVDHVYEQNLILLSE